MTKKRFVKLVMAHGMSRNDAQKIASVANGKTSYDMIYQCWFLADDIVHALNNAVPIVFEIIENSIQTISRLISEVSLIGGESNAKESCGGRGDPPAEYIPRRASTD